MLEKKRQEKKKKNMRNKCDQREKERARATKMIAARKNFHSIKRSEWTESEYERVSE